MMSTLKAEFKKLLNVRSTYLIILLALIIVGIYAFYGEGFKDSAALLEQAPKKLPNVSNLFISGTITQMATFISLFGAIIALLLITHEYRYNTITYTLTTSNSRSKVLAAKFMAVMGALLLYSILLALFGLGMIFLGLAFSHNVLPHQDVNYLTYLGKILFNTEGYGLAALLFGFLIRNQIGSFAALFIIPGTVEGLLSLLLKHNSVYMPFMALNQVVQPPIANGVSAAAHAASRDTGSLSASRGALVFLAYFIFGWIVAWYLFLRRDAS